ncbi:MAG: GspH/FimT family pseudopilin [Lysobacteraceae bacterium]
MRTHQNGITLIELLIATSIVAILLGVAMPAFSGAFEASRASSARSALASNLVTAFSSATNAGSRAVLCPSSDGMTCVSSPDWSNGWIAFLDIDGDHEHQASEPVVARQAALSGKVRLRSTVGRTRIVIQASGSSAGSNVTFTLCDGRGPSKAESLVLNNQGVLHPGVPTATAIAATCVQ